jgi:SagB-type dehydrogenase family enzyme
MEPITLRVMDERVVISTDDGRTVEPTAERADALRAATNEALETLEENAWAFGLPTATTLGALAEARLLRPRTSTYVASSPESRTDQVERMRLGSLAPSTGRAFAEVLASRRSQRSFGPMSLTDLASILLPSARIQGWWEAPDGYTAMQRPTPSAGGRHPLELALLAVKIDGVRPGLWHFDAAACDLVRAEASEGVASVALEEVLAALEGDSTPAAAIFVIADFGRTLSRYPNGMSLVFRDAGALLATLHLCASDAGLASCIVGSAGALVYESDSTLVADVGAVLVGGYTEAG